MVTDSETHLNALGAWLEKHQHSQQWLADRLGVTRPYINKLVNGTCQPSVDMATEIERFTGIPPRAFAKSA